MARLCAILLVRIVVQTIILFALIEILITENYIIEVWKVFTESVW